MLENAAYSYTLSQILTLPMIDALNLAANGK